jgi:hypothetical protein
MSACSGDKADDPLEGNAIVFLQRAPRTGGVGDIFQYTSYIPGARLVKLSPPTADGQLTVLCCESQGAEFAEIDIGSYDLSFDAREVVLSAKLSGDQSYGLFILSLESGQIEQLYSDPTKDYVYPVFLPGDRIFFMSNAVVEEGAPQFRDEYERGTTAQIGTIRRDGSELTMHARNLSHRVYPTVLSDGRVLYTQWDHLGEMNAGHLVISNPDGTVVREGFGKESTGVSNSYLKAMEVSPGRVVAIGTSRDRTLQAGAILDIRLGHAYSDDSGNVLADREMSEARASYNLLTPQVPLGREPSSMGIGRYYDAVPLNAKDKPDLLVSWADGPVESGTLEAAGLSADFGIFLYSASSQSRKPIFNDKNYWDVTPRVLAPRKAPPQIAPSGKNEFNPNAVLLGSLDVYRSSLTQFAPASVYGVRVIEGFSTEEGIPNDFGITDHEGAAVLGVAPVMEDGSWAALIPANVPVHLQTIDRFGMALQSEPVWISGNAGESRLCGGCHEDRASTTVVQPGLTQAIATGPVNLMAEVPRPGRMHRPTTVAGYTRDTTVGVPWDLALQGVFDSKCVGCHDGTAGPGNKSFTITDPMTGASQTFTFNLSGAEVSYGVGDVMLSGYSASHLSLMGPNMMELTEAGLIVSGDYPTYCKPTDARGSVLLQKLNPPQQFPTQDLGVRAFAGPSHPADVGATELTADEYYLMILACDLGGQFYSRENAPGSMY